MKRILVLLIVLTFAVSANLPLANASSSPQLENIDHASSKRLDSVEDQLNINTGYQATKETLKSSTRGTEQTVVEGQLFLPAHDSLSDSNQEAWVQAKKPKASIIMEESAFYSQYSFFAGEVWYDPWESYGRSMSAEFIAVYNNIGGLGSDDWVAFLPVNLAYGFANNHVWIQFAIMFGPGGDVDFYVEQNNYNGGSDYDYGTYWNGREWSTGFSWPQNIGVPYVVGHAYSFNLFVVSDQPNQVEAVIWDHTTNAMWTHVINVPSTDVLYWPYPGGFSPAATIEGLVGTSVTSLTNFPYFEFDITNGMKNLWYTMWVSPPTGIDQFLSKVFVHSYWRWAAVSSASLIPSPVVQTGNILYPSSIALGESASIDVPVENAGGTASWMTIAISFPTNPPTSAISIDYGGTSVDNPWIHTPGETVSSFYGFGGKTAVSGPEVTLSYPLVEGSSLWNSGTTKHLKVTVTPQSVGIFDFYVKSVAAYETYAISWDPDSTTSQIRDQQSEYTHEYVMNVGVSPSVISVSVNPNSIVLGSGATIDGTITSPVSGDKSGTVYLQYSTDNVNWNLIGSTSSSSSGYYSYWWTPLSTGTFYVRSYWNGNSNYGGATSSSVTLTVVTGAGNLGDHTMCKNVQSSSPWDPIDRTSTFYTDDPYAYSWLHFDGPIYGSHIVHWDWYAPDGTHWPADYTIPDARDYGYEYWNWYRTWSSLGPLHFPDNQLGEPFIVRVYYDGNLVVTESWTVIKHQSSITLSLSATSITYGQSITGSSQISPSFSDGTTTLQYSIDQVNWNNFVAGTPSNGYYSNSWTPPSASIYYIRATWSGNLNYYGSTSSVQSLTVDRATTSLTTALSSSTITYGSSVTITATMSPSISGKMVTIQFSLDGSTWYYLTSSNTNSAGQYAYTWTPDAGTYYLRSTWSGDANYYSATSTSQQLTVNKASTSTSLSLSSTMINWGESVTVTATVSVPVSDGTITLEYSAYQLPWTVISLDVPAAGFYSYQWNPPANRSYSVRAIWSGTNNYLGSTSPPQGLDVVGTIYVPTDFSKIQDAINAASPINLQAHYTIYVYAGTYHENLTLSSYNSNMKLLGESHTNTILNGSISFGYSYGGAIENFRVLSGIRLNDGTVRNNIIEGGLVLWGGRYFPSYWNTIENNTFLGGARAGYAYGVAIELEGTWQNNINGNTIIGAEIGIRECGTTEPYVPSANHNTLEGNYFVNCTYGVELWADYVYEWERALSGSRVLNSTFEDNDYAIYLDHVTNVTIFSNSLLGNQNGIYLWYSDENTIVENYVANSTFYGIVLSESTVNTISGNNITGNGSGVWLSESSGNTVYGNIIENNEQNGISLQSSYCIVSGNIITNNGIGIRGWSFFSTISGNNVTDNDYYGINLSISSNNTISNNSITDNYYIGIGLDWGSESNILYGNIITNHENGIFLEGSNNNVSSNNIVNNDCGVFLSGFSNNILYHNNFINNTVHVNLYGTNHIWDNGYPSGGNYWSDYTGVDANADGIGDTLYVVDASNQDNYPLMQPWPSHDIAIKDLSMSKTIVGSGYLLLINVTVADQGDYGENVSLTIYANNTIIATEIVTFTNRGFATLTFTWNTTGFAKGNYTISVFADPVFGETETEDNTLTSSVLKIVTPGDVNADGMVDILDISGISAHWSGPPSGPVGYDSNFDINGDGNIDILDVSIVSAYWTGPPKGPLASQGEVQTSTSEQRATPFGKQSVTFTVFYLRKGKSVFSSVVF